MQTPSPLSTPHVWNDVAAGYAEEVAPILEHYARDALRLAHLPDRAHILDVAAGPGTLALLAAADVNVEKVVALDFAQEMVQELERRIAASGVSNIEVIRANGQTLPFEEGRFDSVFSMFGLIFFPDRPAGFREGYRVLKPGGRAVVSSWAQLGEVPLLSACFGALGDALPEVPFGDEKAPLAEVADFRDEMAGAGFADVAIQTVQHTIYVPSVSAFWEANERSSAPLSLLRKIVDAEEWAELGATVVHRLEREFGRGPIESTWPAYIGVGTRPA